MVCVGVRRVSARGPTLTPTVDGVRSRNTRSHDVWPNFGWVSVPSTSSKSWEPKSCLGTTTRLPDRTPWVPVSLSTPPPVLGPGDPGHVTRRKIVVLLLVSDDLFDQNLSLPWEHLIVYISRTGTVSVGLGGPHSGVPHVAPPTSEKGRPGSWAERRSAGRA